MIFIAKCTGEFNLCLKHYNLNRLKTENNYPTITKQIFINSV